jgi:hypothetical protein
MPCAAGPVIIHKLVRQFGIANTIFKNSLKYLTSILGTGASWIESPRLAASLNDPLRKSRDWILCSGCAGGLRLRTRCAA